ncbi:MAG: acetyl-CoA hydrolase/transferase C-terminal domain-containing protein [Gammaproteobacteria bacterium]|nr:acetyl-CoA hydrolase/transferase C-terminal domain-containing protein [Gammaproteobacteria bacterium]
MTTYFNNYDLIAKQIVQHVDKNVVIGVPLGIGKPIGVINALYRLALNDTSISLTILTALTLTRPKPREGLEKLFLEPILEKILGDYEDPLYEEVRVKQQLPNNIKIIEFFLTSGDYLNNAKVQQDYISTNYTSVVADTIHHSINVIAQQVAHSAQETNEYSLSCNTDLFLDVVHHLKQEEEHGKKVCIVAEVNSNLPFMLGDAIIKAEQFTDIVDTKKYRSLYAIPKAELSLQDFFIGLYSSTLIKDNGSLQIGIGKLGDALTNALILRHKDNALYQDILTRLQVHEKFGDVITEAGELNTFEQGLYASTEMLSDSYLHLYHKKILKKHVYDHVGLQQLLNTRQITEIVTPDFLDILLKNKIINSPLTENDVEFLQTFGIIKSDIRYDQSHPILPTEKLIAAHLGKTLTSGKILHAGFFIGSTDFYQQLRNLPAAELQQFDMTRISKTNTMWSEKLGPLQRIDARFVNASMMFTLEGSIISDGLKDWQEVSGVGGQFDFAVLSQELPLARFIINCHSTRVAKGKVTSNVLWEYPNITLPRNLRDIIITEYGIADCRSKTDADIIKSILNITDSRFQEELLKTAKKHGKIASDYEIPNAFQNNTLNALQPILKELQAKGIYKPYPFGSELTQDEQVIKNALLYLKNSSKLKLITTLIQALLFFQNDTRYENYLARMKLKNPTSIKDFINKKLLKFLIYRVITN